MMPVPLLIGLLGNRVRDPASSQVAAEPTRAVSLVCDHVVGSAAWSAKAGARDADPFQQSLCTDAVVTLAWCDENGERAALAVAGEVDFGGQPSSGTAEGVIVRFVLPVPPPFRPVAAAC